MHRAARCRRCARQLRSIAVQPPASSDTWLVLTDELLPIAEAYQWCVQPQCGAVVLFSGTVRDHAVDDAGLLRSGVSFLDYEAYESQVVPVFQRIADEVRVRWPNTGRVALLHRSGRIELEESSVVVAVSAPHRPEAFEAARYAIDALKSSAPIWKREQWTDGTDWGTGAHEPVDPTAVPTVSEPSRADSQSQSSGVR